MEKYNQIQNKMRVYISDFMEDCQPTLVEAQPLLYCALLCGAFSAEEYNKYIDLCVSFQSKT